MQVGNAKGFWGVPYGHPVGITFFGEALVIQYVTGTSPGLAAACRSIELRDTGKEHGN